jgi:2-hydroxy-6-oxonona-2,4-dienedioate hydrolase
MRKIVVVVLLASLSFGATFLFIDYRREMARARFHASSGSQIAATACGPIEYAIEGEGPPVLVVHGAGGGFDQGLAFGQPLAEWGFRVIAVFRFGYLRTPLPRDASPEAQGDAHACLLDALHVDRVAVMGGSAGAPSAMQLCLRHPERCSSMVLVVPLAFAEKAPGEVPRSPSGMALFLMEKALRSDFGFWIASTFARDSMVGSILATPPSDVAKADVDEQRRVREMLRHIEPISWRAAGL